jgi:hypothetical protein
MGIIVEQVYLGQEKNQQSVVSGLWVVAMLISLQRIGGSRIRVRETLLGAISQQPSRASHRSLTRH